MTLAGPVRAAPSVGVDAEGPALPSVEDEPGAEPLPDLEPETPEPETSKPETSEPEGAPGPEGSAGDPGTVEPPPPTLQEPEIVRVAVGFSPELDGNKDEKQLLDQLEASVKASPDPQADVRRLRVGAAEAADVCREGRDDLVIRVGYLPDRSEPVLMTRDCRIEEELGVRSAVAAEDPALLGVLWAEHDELVANGARERRRARVSPKVRTGLIAGAAVAVIGLAVGLLIAGAIQRESVVLVVSP